MPKLSHGATAGAGLAVVAVVVVVIGLIVLRMNVHSASSRTGDGPAPLALPTTALPTRPRALAAAIEDAQTMIDHPASTPQALAAAALTEQLAVRRLSGETRRDRRATLALLRPRAAAATRADLAAADALMAIATRPKNLPKWRIVQPPAPDTLRGYFVAAGRRYRVRWQYLAAIEFIETRFGRINGTSTAGAQGPMQFLPSTWARYGRGSIDDPRDAILAAARFLVANGARRNISAALYAYNNSLGYVNGVLGYARWMRTDPRAYYGYYHWQVIYNRAGGAVILPLGYPTVRPVPIR
jgi:membrane-bound lytic murein transglycosylase B